MNTQERRTTFAVSLIMAFRMLGLFMILPVFSVAARTYADATPQLIGLALGVYGLTQACLQMPFGLMSDRLGRKPIILTGLVLFAIGSLVAALAHNLHLIIIGRALQGGGAIGSTLIALLADFTRPEQRTKAMACMGMTIGIAFSAAMVLGPLVARWHSLSAIFWLTALLALLGIVVLFYLVPAGAPVLDENQEPLLKKLWTVLTDKELLRLDAGIFLQHAALTASFLVIPVVFHHSGITTLHAWRAYLPILVIAFLCMVPLIILAEKKQKMRPIFLGCIAMIGISQCILALSYHVFWVVCFALLLFFIAFNCLEACLPSLVSKRCPAASKGTAMGIYSSSQFLGIFFGGTVGGIVYAHIHIAGVFALVAGFALVWLLIAFGMQPIKVSSKNEE
ncbi:MAG: MFS transporter [marine bacterium B5-7]|nr:MAG: MFS transporter [marine bacterium B5-7]